MKYFTQALIYSTLFLSTSFKIIASESTKILTELDDKQVKRRILTAYDGTPYNLSEGISIKVDEVLLPEEISAFLNTQETTLPYARLMTTLKNRNYETLKPSWKILVAQKILKKYTSHIKTKEDLDTFYRIVRREKDNPNDTLVSYLSDLITTQWKSFPDLGIPPSVINFLISMIDMPHISTPYKNKLITLLYIDETSSFLTPTLNTAIEDFIFGNEGKVRYDPLISLVESNKIDIRGSIINRILTEALETPEKKHYQKRTLAATLLENETYVMHFLKHSDPSTIDHHQKILSQFLKIEEKNGAFTYKIKASVSNKLLMPEEVQGIHLPRIEGQDNLDSIYEKWLNSRATLTFNNMYDILYPPSQDIRKLEKHARFLRHFFLTEGRLDHTDLKYFDLWGLIEDSNSEDYEDYANIPGDWRKVLWEVFFELPQMKSGELLPKFPTKNKKNSGIDDDYVDTSNAWLESHVVLKKSNYSKVFNSSFPSIHGEFLIKFFENHHRFEGTDLTYSDLERILRNDISNTPSGDWKKAVIKSLLPKVIFVEDQIIPKSLNLLIDYIQEHSLPPTMIQSLMIGLRQDNLSIEEKCQIVEVLGENVSYREYCEALDRETKESFSCLISSIKPPCFNARIIEERSQKPRGLSDGSSDHTTVENTTPTNSPPRTQNKREEKKAAKKVQKEEIAKMTEDAELALKEERYQAARSMYIKIQKQSLEIHNQKQFYNPEQEKEGYLKVMKLNQKIRQISSMMK